MVELNNPELDSDLVVGYMSHRAVVAKLVN